MLETLIVILVLVWLLGMGGTHLGHGDYTGGGLIHGLLVVALVVVVIRLLQGRKVL